VENILPKIRQSDYYTVPSLTELAILELRSPGYCSRVRDFVVGRVGYGCIKFVDETDVRHLDLNSIVKFNRCEVIVYEDDDDDSFKPSVGQGLNKPAEVSLLLQSTKHVYFSNRHQRRRFLRNLRCKTEIQGAKFISFDIVQGTWNFAVQHFSRFGLSAEDEEDILMEDAPSAEEAAVDAADQMDDRDGLDIDEEASSMNQILLSHSLPARLGLDPARMKNLRSLFRVEEDDVKDVNGVIPSGGSESPPRSLLSHSSRKKVHKKNSSPSVHRAPVPLLEYKAGSFSSVVSHGGILMSLHPEKRGSNVKATKSEGFTVKLGKHTPISSKNSRSRPVDAALFMGRSFRVGWGPGGILVHSGTPVFSVDSRIISSSVINIEQVATDKSARNEKNEVIPELVGACFESPLKHHMESSRESKKVGVDTFRINLRKLVCDRFSLPDICRRYIDEIERQLEVPGLPSSSRYSLVHQVLVWELIKVLFSKRKIKPMDGGDDDMIPDQKDSDTDIDEEALPLLRRAEFSYWLQESCYDHVLAEVSSFDEQGYLKQIFLLLTGRQLDNAVELAASRGDVRLACLLSQAGGSTSNRADIAYQLDLWRKNGLDFDFIEDDRVRILELLAGNIHESLKDVELDWKRFLGLLMWYKLPPDISLPVVFNTYQKLLNEGSAPYPVPIYIDEGPREEAVSWNAGGHFDLAYYLMLLHAREENDFGALKTMFSASASTYDPLDYHMIWHQRAVLEAVGTFTSNDLHILDMSFVSQLLSAGLCHWAIYVVLHIPYREDHPYLHMNVIKEILFQYCAVWSAQDSQWEFIENLGIPSEWLHESLAIYSSYYGDYPKALQHFLDCGKWQRAHSIFLVSVAHSLFLSGKHSEIWNFATSMEDHKSEIEDWEVGAGIYLSFYSLKRYLTEDIDTAMNLQTLETKIDMFSDFMDRLKQSSVIWGSKFSVEGRVVSSKMAEEICGLVVSCSGGRLPCEDQLSCYDTVFKAPIPEDLRSHYLKDAVSVFTSYL
ncbi:hypothetical protein M569_03229, partial [Genlisea aurea]